MTTGSTPELIVDWFFAIMFFIVFPLAILLSVTDWWFTKVRPSASTSAEQEADSIPVTKDEVEGPRYRQTKHVERRMRG